MRELLLARKLAKEQQVGGFFKAEPLFPDKAAHDLLHVDAPVVELALTGNGFAVHHLLGDDVGDLGQAGEDTVAVQVAQAPFDLIAGVELGIDAAVAGAELGQGEDLRSDFGKVDLFAGVLVDSHGASPFCAQLAARGTCSSLEGPCSVGENVLWTEGVREDKRAGKLPVC